MQLSLINWAPTILYFEQGNVTNHSSVHRNDTSTDNFLCSKELFVSSVANYLIES